MSVQESETRAAVLTERRDQILIITLNRPQVRNAVDQELATGLAAALDELDRDGRLLAGVLTGAGGFFCAGMDLGAFTAGGVPVVDGRGFAGVVERPPAKPLIAAIEGFAIAGGLEIALACDLIVCARGARMGIPEARRSLVALGGALLRLPRRMPYHVVMELALTGELMSAEIFHRFGVVNRLVDDGEALAAALDLAGNVVASGPLAVTASKQILAEQWDWNEAEAWVRQNQIAAPVIESEDAQEGALAFKSRREPQWKGR